MHRLALISLLAWTAHAEATASFEQVQSVLNTYCITCHQGQRAAAKIDLTRFPTAESVLEARATWSKVLARVRGSEMPPKGSPVPDIDAREKFVSWVEGTLHQAACVGGLAPGPSLIRRLNRDEYSATIRDLLNI